MNSRGQVLLETIFVLPAFLLISSIILVVILLFFSQFYIEYHLQEATFCYMNQELRKENNSCYAQLKVNIQRVPFLKWESIQLNQSENLITAEAKYKIPVPFCSYFMSELACLELSIVPVNKILNVTDWN